MTNQTIKVIIADDHAVFLDGLGMLLEKDAELEVIATAQNGRDLISRAMQLEPDVVVTDIEMPGINGIEAIKILTETAGIRCIALSTFDDESYIMDAIDAGAAGYILKNAARGEIVKGIKVVNNYSRFYCKSTEAKMIRIMAKAGAPVVSDKTGAGFTARDIEIIKLVAMEVESREISKRLHISRGLVHAERSKLLSEMGVKSAVGMVVYALKRKLISLDDLPDKYG